MPLWPFLKIIFLKTDFNAALPAGNPLSQDILNLYQEPDGTRKLLNYMLDNLAGDCSRRCRFGNGLLNPHPCFPSSSQCTRSSFPKDSGSL